MKKSETRTRLASLSVAGEKRSPAGSGRNRRRQGMTNLRSSPAIPRPCALELAAREHSERRALENEIALLKYEWQEAEEIAAIAAQLPFGIAGTSQLSGRYRPLSRTR